MIGGTESSADRKLMLLVGKGGGEEEELAIDVEANTATENDKKSTQRPILIQTIIFDEDKFQEDVPTSEFGLKNANNNIKTDEFDTEQSQDEDSNVLGIKLLYFDSH